MHLTAPRDGATLHSSYAVVEGQASPGERIEILDGASTVASTRVDGTGRFERVIRLAGGPHRITVRCRTEESGVQVEISASPAARSPAPYELLQTGDVILAHDRNSRQDALYQPVYTHAAMYIGPDADGAPRLLEAVAGDDATPDGLVATVAIEESLAWRKADRVDVYRLDGALGSEDRNRILQWARRIAARGVTFRASEVSDYYRAWLWWDPKHDRPRQAGEFNRVIAELRGRLEATDAYDCATLVWHAYLDNTAGRVDLARPNRVQWRGAMKNVSERFLATLNPLVILPDSLALSGKLRRVLAQ